METLLDFASGPLFRLSFGLMILGLIRIIILDIWGAISMHHKAGDKNLPLKDALIKTLSWLFPVKRTFSKRPVYSLFSVFFHIGLIIVPIFLYAHILLWKDGIGLSWAFIPKYWADLLTITTIVFGVALFISRLASRDSRFLSRVQDYIWPILLIIPFTTGYICANMTISAFAYKVIMLIHILSAELIFILIPFSKIAHCVLIPFSQFILTLGWKFPANLDDKIAATLKQKEELQP